MGLFFPRLFWVCFLPHGRLGCLFPICLPCLRSSSPGGRFGFFSNCLACMPGENAVDSSPVLSYVRRWFLKKALKNTTVTAMWSPTVLPSTADLPRRSFAKPFPLPGTFFPLRSLGLPTLCGRSSLSGCLGLWCCPEAKTLAGRQQTQPANRSKGTRKSE